ncbi:PstA family ABC transporter permease [Streptomyces sp. PTD9-10]|uniref:PstA family ABC transporter permease n=1 Tax=Streptomyces sp. PTD9-10 TaxID=3120151 RepID=UPI0030091CD9
MAGVGLFLLLRAGQALKVRGFAFLTTAEWQPDVPRRIGGPTRSGVLSLTGAAASGLCTAVLLFGQLAPFSGGLGFTVTAYLAFLLVYAVLTGLEENGQAVRDRVMTVVLWSAATLLFVALALVVDFTAWRGREALPHANFFTQDMQAAGPLDPLTNGGIAHAMLGTLTMITIALVITVPLGLACAVYLNQIPGRFSRFVRTIVEAMTALPSIVAGLMVYATWILGLGMQKSGLAAGFAISVMMLPIAIRAADVVLRLVPGTLTEAAEALGARAGARCGTWSCPPPARVSPRRSSSAPHAASARPRRCCSPPGTRRR